MSTIAHHVDCDGYRFAHLATTVPVYPCMVRAECEHCGWHSGTYSLATGLSTARRDADQHTEEVACDGRCASWT